MNERQRDLFLWLWSQRRKPGQAAIAMRGALIGGLGGLAFAFMMSGGVGDGLDLCCGGGGLAPFLGRWVTLLALSVGMFAGLGFLLASRVFASHEAMYQSMLASGARVPETKPAMEPGDRGPAVAVGIAATVIALFIVYLFVRLG